MKIHEYQGKEILKSYGIPIQDGYVIDNIEDAQLTINKVHLTVFQFRMAT